MDQRATDLTVAGLAFGALVGGVVEARRGSLRSMEARWFAGLNRVSARGHVPVWAAMQLGSLGGSLAVGAAVARAGRPRLGRRLATVGALAWAGSKVVKPFAQRGRPASVVEAARVLGREQAGLGYPSGHAAVAVAMALAAAPHVGPRWRAPLVTGATAVGAARIYVGAHLPLDVAGGVALGVATERVVRALRGPA
ncbi:MAG TPA: phosphatase PAP2 family protein [Acidimicrobiales bacterium]|nr:phosphatase PAP2 family protein [Acidimicrobiales bacterium]